MPGATPRSDLRTTHGTRSDAGYEEGEHAFEFPFASMAGWTPLQGGDFPTGLLGDVGVLRTAQSRSASRCPSRTGLSACSPGSSVATPLGSSTITVLP